MKYAIGRQIVFGKNVLRLHDGCFVVYRATPEASPSECYWLIPGTEGWSD